MPKLPRIAIAFHPSVAVSAVLLAILCASGTWWLLQFSKPPQRALAAAPTPSVQIDNAAIALLFGRGSAVASNYQLKGIVLAYIDSDSVAIVSADGKPARAAKIGSEIGPGVRVLEIRADGVLLSDNGVQKQVPLPRPQPRSAKQEKPAAK
jgi:general secretion pathway protein C